MPEGTLLLHEAARLSTGEGSATPRRSRRTIDEKYPIGSEITGTVRNLTNYGAFIEIEEGIDGLLHVSDMSWVRKIAHPNEVVTKGQTIKCKLLSIDKKNRRIALGLKQLTEDPWVSRIPENYKAGQLVTGKVTKITNFGVFVSLEDDLEGLLHISELANHKVDNPEDVVKVGEEIEVKVLRVDCDERKIGLSRKRAEWTEEEAAQAEAEEAPNAPRTTPRRSIRTSSRVEWATIPVRSSSSRPNDFDDESVSLESGRVCE